MATQNLFQQLIQDEIKKRMGDKDDPKKLLANKKAELELGAYNRVLNQDPNNPPTRADSSIVYPATTLPPSPETKKKAVEKKALKKKSEKEKLEEKIVKIANKDNELDDPTPEEQALIDNVPADSVEAYKNRVVQRQLDKLGIDSSKVKTDTINGKCKM